MSTRTYKSNTRKKQQQQHILYGSSPKKADGETVPLLRDTMTLMPVSMKGTEKSITSDLSSLMVREPTAMSAFFVTT